MVTPFQYACWLSRIACVSLFCLAPIEGRSQDFRVESAGARVGFGTGDANAEFLQSEAFVDWDLPWRWDLGKEWHLQTRLDLSFGWLGETGAHGLSGVVGSAGPLVALGRGRFPLFLEGGVSPTGLSRYDYYSKDFGIQFQFTSHIGLGYDVSSRFRLNLRFQHMSNADISHQNPGLNLMMFGVSCIF